MPSAIEEYIYANQIVNFKQSFTLGMYRWVLEYHYGTLAIFWYHDSLEALYIEELQLYWHWSNNLNQVDVEMIQKKRITTDSIQTQYDKVHIVNENSTTLWYKEKQMLRLAWCTHAAGKIRKFQSSFSICDALVRICPVKFLCCCHNFVLLATAEALPKLVQNQTSL